MIAAGQQFAAAVSADVVHLAFWSMAEDGWRLACTDEIAQLQEQDPILSCATCIEVADEEVAGDPVLLFEGGDVEAFLDEMAVTTSELVDLASRPDGVSPRQGRDLRPCRARELSSAYGG